MGRGLATDMKTVMVVDDDLMLADTIEDILTEAGYTVCGVAGSVAEAICLGERLNPELGVIDLRLAQGEWGTDIAAILRKHISFGVLYTTGSPEHPKLSTADGEASLVKPFSSATLVASLRIVTALMQGEPAPNRLPRGFRLLQGASHTGLA